MTYARTMNAALFLVFLGKLLRSTTGKLFLIVDRLQAHQTPAVKAWVATHSERLEVFPSATTCVNCKQTRERRAG